MDAITTVLLYEIWILLAGLAAVIAYQLLTKQIKTDGLLRDKTSNSSFSPGRLQLLVLTIAGAFYYLILTLGNEKSGEFPEIPNELLLALGGSHMFYLGGKLYSLIAQVFGLSAPKNK